MNKKDPTIIFLNGASSSGKTTIAKAIKSISNQNLLHLSIDQLIDKNKDMLEYVDSSHLSGFHKSIVAYHEAGNNIIVDHTLLKGEWYMECADLLRNKKAYFIGLDCPLDELNSREKVRNDRPEGTAEHQLSKVHHNGSYDLRLDTSELNPEACAKEILTFIESSCTPKAFNEISHSTYLHFIPMC